jgi:ribosomal-protein-alanine N-acetyltransferase
MSQISLFKPRRADALALIEANLANRAHHAPWAQPFTDQAGFDAWFDQILTGANQAFIARDKITNGIIGVFNLSQISMGNFCSAYLGFHGMAEFGGRGLMSEALRMLISSTFRDLGLHRLEANIQPANAASIALVKANHFRLEGLSPRYLRIGGEWRDHERWAVLADDPHPGLW